MSLLRDMYRDLDAFGRFWFALGLGALAAAAAMSFDFGWQVSTKHAIFLAVLTIVAAFGPMAAEMLFSKGRKGPAIATALVCVPLLGIEFYSHAGYTAGLRGYNIETAGVQNARYDGAQQAVVQDETNLKFWQDQLKTLMERDAWTATVTADALRKELKVIEDRMSEEEKGKRGRRAGKGAEFERLQNQAVALGEKIAKVEQRETLTKQINDTQRTIDKKREVASTTEHKSSAVAKQNDALKTWVAMTLNGDTKATEFQAAAAQESASLAMAVAGTGLPAFALFLAGLFRLSRRHDGDDPPPGNKAPVTDKPFKPYAGIPSEPVHVHTREEVFHKDRIIRDWARDPMVASLADEVKALLGTKKLQAA